MADDGRDFSRDTSAIAADDTGGRGRLTIADRVVERVAVHAASGVDGTTAVGSRLGRVVGRSFPRADVEIAGHRVRVTMTVATVWPAVLAEVTSQVRQSVTRSISDLVGMHVDSVDVHAGKVVQPGDVVVRRRRVQ